MKIDDSGLLVMGGMLTAVAYRPTGVPAAVRASMFGRVVFDLDRLRRGDQLARLDQTLASQADRMTRLTRLKTIARLDRLHQLHDRLRQRPLRAVAEEVLLGVPAPMREGVFAVRPFIPNLIVNAGENFLVDAWQNLVELEIMKYHGIGTGATAATEGDTTLGTELTTQYNPDNTRATGSLTEGASTNIFRTVGTNTVDATAGIQEWGLFSQAATGGGTLWSRVVFAAINLASGDSLQTQYDLTVE